MKNRFAPTPCLGVVGVFLCRQEIALLVLHEGAPCNNSFFFAAAAFPKMFFLF
jgi:hypothetical protein